MINTSELRVGNYFMLNGKRVKLTMQDIIGVFAAYTGEFKPYELEPITITQELLIEAGCKKSGKIIWYPLECLKCEMHFETIERTSEIVATIKSDFAELILDRIDYLHELQNLIYSLSKKEIELP